MEILHRSRLASLGRACVVAFIAACFAGSAHAAPPGSGWTLSYDEEFTSLPAICQTVGAKTPGWLPTDNWNNHGGVTNASNGWARNGDGEEEYYCFPGIDSGYNPFSIGTGSEGVSVLNITANKTPAGMNAQSLPYVSGILSTAVGANYSVDIQSSTPFSQQYGYFECRAKLPTGQGIGYWPAFWMLPADGTGPSEYDIFEVLGNSPTTIYQTAHFSNGTQDSFAYKGPDTSNGFHTYGFEWDAANIRWYVDGVLAQTQANTVNKPMYVLFDLSIGGSWAGNPTASTTFPGAMQVEYLRVYSGGTVNLASDTPTMPTWMLIILAGLLIAAALLNTTSQRPLAARSSRR